jgi:hypothetical protein
MAWDTARTFLRSICSRDDDEVALSRRDMLAGIGLAGLLVAAPKFLAPGVAEAKTLAPAAEPVDSAEAKVAEHDAGGHKAADDGDATDLSARRRWRRRYWRRRYYWRRRHWRRRYYWRRPWRRRYWRRRYYRRVW